MSSSSWSVPASDFENHGGEVSRRRDAQTHRGDDRASRTGRGADRGRGRWAVAVGARGCVARKLTRETSVHHRDTLRGPVSRCAPVCPSRDPTPGGRKTKRGNGYVVREPPARVFSTRRLRRARSSRRASPRHRRPPRAPHRPPHRSPFRARRARRRRAQTRRGHPRPPVSRARAVASCLALVFLPVTLARAPRRASSRVAIHPDANDVIAAATIVAAARRHALGTAAVPGRVHFLVSDAPGAWTPTARPRPRGRARLAPRRSSVCPRRRASSDRDVLAVGTDQSV